MLNTTQREQRNMLTSICREPYAWPGGYERLLLLADGALLCAKCVREEGARIMSDIRDGCDTGWLPAGTCMEAVSPECTPEGDESECGHCWKPIGETT